MDIHTMQDFKNNSIDFEQLMRELLELEKNHPEQKEIQELKEIVQKELNRRKSNESEKTDDARPIDDFGEGLDASAILESIYSSAEKKQRSSSSHSHHSSHRQSSHSHHHSSKGFRHPRHHHNVIPTSSDTLSGDMDFEDLVYKESNSSEKFAKTKPSTTTNPDNADYPNAEMHLVKEKGVSETHNSSSVHTENTSASFFSSKKLSTNQRDAKAKEKTQKRILRKGGWKSLKSWQRTVSVVICVILLFVLAGSFSFQHLMNRINRIDSDEIPELSKEGLEDLLTLSREELEKLRASDPDAESIIIDKKNRYGVGDVKITPMQRDDVLNILLIGQDRRKGDKGQMRSDSMILVTIDKSSKEMKLTSLMRDMYVPVPGYGYGMINATLLNGGMKLLNATIEQDLGVHIDGDIQIDFYRFIKLMDLVGPLEIELNTDEVKYFNGKYGWDLVKGVNSLNSEQILAYCRVRSVGRSDWERTDRQRRVIQTIYKKLKKSDIRTLLKFTYDAMPLITTNIDKNSELIRIVYTILRNRMPITESSRIPLEGTYTQEVKEGVLHVLVPDLYPNAKALQTIAFGHSNIK